MVFFGEQALNVNKHRRRIRQLDPGTPMHLRLSEALKEGAGFGGAWYTSQKQHWLGWLRDYSGPGAYGRKAKAARGARFVYNHGQCAPMPF